MKLCALSVCIMALHAGVLADTASAGEVLDRIEAKGVLTVASDPAWPPYSWIDETGNWKGFDAAVASEIARRMGVKIAFATPSWETLTAGNWTGEWDLSVGSMSPTEDRAKVLDFPASYYFSPMVLAVHESNTTIQSPTDASGKRIGALKGSIFEKYLRGEPTGMSSEMQPEYRIANAAIQTYETSEAALRELAKGADSDLDAMVDDMMYFLFQIEQGQPVRIVGQPLDYGPAAIAIAPGDPELGARLAEIVTEMQADGTLSALSTEWFGVDLTQKF
ncbi:transporter substrate-binding domain-containing protein [Tabrizicola sp. BL-A-41-H6]|uniref:transporter substrate-binding domain-containing protein n=1 Tax=Tabrizicola sp. BL-A-41-H6 TaxID=3421107 RepID=UPI003D6654C1